MYLSQTFLLVYSWAQDCFLWESVLQPNNFTVASRIRNHSESALMVNFSNMLRILFTGICIFTNEHLHIFIYYFKFGTKTNLMRSGLQRRCGKIFHRYSCRTFIVCKRVEFLRIIMMKQRVLLIFPNYFFLSSCLKLFYYQLQYLIDGF